MMVPDSPTDPPELILQTRAAEPEPAPRPKVARRTLRAFAALLLVLLILAPAGYFYARHWIRSETLASLPQIDGSLAVPGLSAPVTVQRDAHGVPRIRAAGLDDLLLAQGFVTASDRLFQMDMLRRHAAGELAAVYGSPLLGHDRLQRTLQIRAAADRAAAQLPPDQLHMLQVYAQGVNAAIAAQSAHLPIEFRLLRYQPAPWTPRDSLLVSLAMFQDLTTSFPTKLARESLTSRLPADLRAQLEEDLYPEGSWRDHPPSMPIPDLTIEGPPIEDVPLDESQSSLHLGTPTKIRAPFLALLSYAMSGSASESFPSSLFPLPCPTCRAGSNNWAVSGAHTASGKPLLSNDMHLGLTLPGIWYEADLEVPSAAFHAAGVSLPGVPLIVAGHNDHIAWGFTNVGADVQDLYLETTRGTGPLEEFRAADGANEGSWQPVVHLPEPITVKGGKTVAFEVLATRHGDTLTPILNPVLTAGAAQPQGHARTVALRWTIYDPATLGIPSFALDSAHDWPSFLAAVSQPGWPGLNVVYADDRGHIGFHVIGRIPIRGPAPIPDRAPSIAPSAMGGPATTSTGKLPQIPIAPDEAHEWSGYIPFDELPQIFDPPSGVIATANARTTPDGYPYAITQDWGGPYRNERIWRLLAHSKGLTPASMLAIQTDIYSEFDRMLAERLTYALDHALADAAFAASAPQRKSLHQAADLLRAFDGRMATESAAATILATTHAILWPMLLRPKLQAPATETLNDTYLWGERDYALEQILMHTPARWLPGKYPDWNAFLASAVLEALNAAHAPADLAKWNYGSRHPVDIEHPLFSQSEPLRRLLGRPTGTGRQPQSGDRTTIKQVDQNFGPSQRFTADLAHLDRSTLNIVLGESGNPDSPWFLDQFPAWLHGATFPISNAVTHTLTLTPAAALY
jgi:penicillin amidase